MSVVHVSLKSLLDLSLFYLIIRVRSKILWMCLFHNSSVNWSNGRINFLCTVPTKYLIIIFKNYLLMKFINEIFITCISEATWFLNWLWSYLCAWLDTFGPAALLISGRATRVPRRAMLGSGEEDPWRWLYYLIKMAKKIGYFVF